MFCGKMCINADARSWPLLFFLLFWHHFFSTDSLFLKSGWKKECNFYLSNTSKYQRYFVRPENKTSNKTVVFPLNDNFPNKKKLLWIFEGQKTNKFLLNLCWTNVFFFHTCWLQSSWWFEFISIIFNGFFYFFWLKIITPRAKKKCS